MNREAIEADVYGQIATLAREIGNDSSGLGLDDAIPASGLLDSAGILQLIVWVESAHGIEIPQESITVDNFGTVRAIANYIATHSNQDAGS